jgi:acyl-coenzyme A thioesterase PaaI-like protein
MTGARFEPVRLLKARRDEALARLVERTPYHAFLGVGFQRLGDELTGRLAYSDMLIGNPAIPAIHGGVTGAFLEITAIVQLAWDAAWEIMESGPEGAARIAEGRFPPSPKTVDVTIDYLRAGRPRDAYARAQVTRRGRRVANVRVECWQDERARPIAVAHGHFLLPEAP